MSKPKNRKRRPPSQDATAAPEERVFGLEEELEQGVVEALAKSRNDRLKVLVDSLHYTEVADLLEHLNPEERSGLIELIRFELDPAVLSELDENVRDEVIDLLSVDEVAAAVSELESDDAVEIIEEMDEEEQKQILEAIPAGERSLIEEGLSYPEDSAGRLMQRELVTVPTYWNVGETIDFMRRGTDEDGSAMPEQFYDIFVTDPAFHPVGSVPLSRLLQSKRTTPVTDIMEPEMKLIPVTTDQEEVAFLFRQRNLVSAPVVDDDGRLVGAITVDDVVDVIDEEHEEDIMRLGGVSEDDLYSAAIDTTRSRFSWLFINLLTAITASVVIGMFKATIEQIVALAILMPIVASMGGNAGTQTMTVTVRALAMKELTPTNVYRVIGKEFLVGGFNGILFAVLTGVVTWAWFSSTTLGFVIALAMIVNLIVAGLVGTLIPLMLDRSGHDPAIASSVILTTITDVVGFASFLGLAAWILL
jgi:magnesium transporter